MEFCVSLEGFEGPLDLMLHLISRNKLDLFDLNMNVLAEQYVEFIRKVQKANLEVASEYMVELVSLLEYKSKQLLPRKEAELPDSYEEDQRALLAARLLEYQKYKEASRSLLHLYEQRSHHFDRPRASLVEDWSQPESVLPKEGQSVQELIRAMNRVLRRKALLDPYTTSVEVKELSVEERIGQLQVRMDRLEAPFRFETLLEDALSLHECIVTFLSLLELIHMGRVAFHIDEEEVIWIQPNPAP